MKSRLLHPFSILSPSLSILFNRIPIPIPFPLKKIRFNPFHPFNPCEFPSPQKSSRPLLLCALEPLPEKTSSQKTSFAPFALFARASPHPFRTSSIPILIHPPPSLTILLNRIPVPFPSPAHKKKNVPAVLRKPRERFLLFESELSLRPLCACGGDVRRRAPKRRLPQASRTPTAQEPRTCT